MLIYARIMLFFYQIYAQTMLPFTRIPACICSKLYFYVIMLLCFKHKVPIPTDAVSLDV